MTTSTVSPSPRPYFRPTTAAQRRLLFETYEATGSVTEACQRAHVGRGTFYYWWPRFDARGYPALDLPASRAPHHPGRAPLAAELRAEVVAYKQAHPDAGYTAVANALRQAHGWEPVIGPTSVRKILRAELPPPPPPPAVVVKPPCVRAPAPGVTCNIDLGFVPAQHEAGTPLDGASTTAPAVLPPEGATAEEAHVPPSAHPPEGGVAEASASVPGRSSPEGDGAVEPAPPPPPAGATYPGQVFAQAGDYADQMRAYVAQRTEKRAAARHRPRKRRQPTPEELGLQTDADTVALQHRTARQRWLEAEAAWKVARQAHAAFLTFWQGLSRPERRTRRAELEADASRWQAARTAYQAAQAARTAANRVWRDARQQLHARAAQLPPPPPLLFAFLVGVDNCSRRLFCLPVFVAGKSVTAEMVVAALRPLFPIGFQFVISDNGCQFIAEQFIVLEQEKHFIHVRIAPRRPCTNGIAERQVQTVKAWLSNQTWHSAQELEALLAEFLTYYHVCRQAGNDRPHQGEGMAGLSPNEFERRFIQCSTS